MRLLVFLVTFLLFLYSCATARSSHTALSRRHSPGKLRLRSAQLGEPASEHSTIPRSSRPRLLPEADSDDVAPANVPSRSSSSSNAQSTSSTPIKPAKGEGRGREGSEKPRRRLLGDRKERGAAAEEEKLGKEAEPNPTLDGAFGGVSQPETSASAGNLPPSNAKASATAIVSPSTHVTRFADTQSSTNHSSEPTAFTASTARLTGHFKTVGAPGTIVNGPLASDSTASSNSSSVVSSSPGLGQISTSPTSSEIANASEVLSRTERPMQAALGRVTGSIFQTVGPDVASPNSNAQPTKAPSPPEVTTSSSSALPVTPKDAAKVGGDFFSSGGKFGDFFSSSKTIAKGTTTTPKETTTSTSNKESTHTLKSISSSISSATSVIKLSADALSTASKEQSIQAVFVAKSTSTTSKISPLATTSRAVAVLGNSGGGQGMTVVSTGAVALGDISIPSAATAAQTSASVQATSISGIAASTAPTAGVGSLIVPQAGSSTASPGDASSAADNSGTPVAASAAATTSAFVLPGKSLQVLPIGLGVFAGVSVLALVVVGVVTYERKRYRKQFRQRKMAEQVSAAAGYGITGGGGYGSTEQGGGRMRERERVI